MFNLNVINTYMTIISMLVHGTFEFHHSNDRFLNVGTVLFSRNDLNKRVWDRTKLEQLEARRYFQSILPSPRFIDTLNEDYVNDLLNYFSNTISTVKREASEPGLADVLEKALSDAVAGYLKVWVLPVTKFAYYGGVVSEESALNAFEYYDKLRSSLNTDGSGWRDPNEGILDSITISVVPYIDFPQSRSMKNPCEHIAYYEKDDNSLSIATPYINWNETPHSMFLPLKNESSILLNSPSSSKALMKYYDVAKTCCHESGDNGCNEFDDRFQVWLSKDVVPHLNDDKLYVAFGGVLSLLNKTQDLYDKMTDYNENKEKSIFTIYPPIMNSKKFLILIIVVFLEIVWCVPTLLYLLCYRKKHYTKQRTLYFIDIFRRRNSMFDCQTIERMERNEGTEYFSNKNNSKEDFSKICEPRIKDSLQIIHPRTQKTEVDTQYPSHTSKRSTGQMTESFVTENIIHTNKNDSVSVTNEVPIKSSLKQKLIKSSRVQTKSHLSRNKAVASSQAASPGRHTVKTINKIIGDKSVTNSKTDMKRISFHESANQPLSEETHVLCADKKDETGDICPCTCCIDEDRRIFEASQTKKNNYKRIESKPGPVKKNANANIDKPIKFRKQTDSSRTINITKSHTKCRQDVKMNITKGIKLNSGEPTVEIRIDKPPAIRVDVTKCSVIDRRHAKPSRIPRKTPFNEEKTQNKLNATQTDGEACVCTQATSKAGQRRAVDDNVTAKRAAKGNKLNVTL